MAAFSVFLNNFLSSTLMRCRARRPTMMMSAGVEVVLMKVAIVVEVVMMKVATRSQMLEVKSNSYRPRQLTRPL